MGFCDVQHYIFTQKVLHRGHSSRSLAAVEYVQPYHGIECQRVLANDDGLGIEVERFDPDFPDRSLPHDRGGIHVHDGTADRSNSRPIALGADGGGQGSQREDYCQ